MPIFEVSKDNIARLSDVEFRELVARLCEAELARRGILTKARVRWSGSQTAPDGELDVEVRAPEITFKGDFLPALPCGLQVKKPQMGPAKIGAEMRPENSLRAVIQQLVRRKTAATSSSAWTTTVQPSRLFRQKGHARRSRRHGGPRAPPYGFLRSRPSCELVAGASRRPAVGSRKLGMPMTGWRPHHRWSSTPREAEDTLIVEDGMTMGLPGKQLDSVGLAGRVEWYAS